MSEETPARNKRRSSAEDMAKSQKEISVSEFFAKNRHLLGFDNPRKALLTTVKEAVDNSLDAREEAGVLPEIWVHIESTGKDKYKAAMQDNGPVRQLRLFLCHCFCVNNVLTVLLFYPDKQPSRFRLPTFQ
ncbi:MAG: hypothetical protein LBT46_10000 [Planctomycetaceae bacterium]|jgi:DNA topoisomerase-6 subunit B|nr:hypothetical protein [Planctomycetaceae bacterium]